MQNVLGGRTAYYQYEQDLTEDSKKSKIGLCPLCASGRCYSLLRHKWATQESCLGSKGLLMEIQRVCNSHIDVRVISS